MDQESMKLKVMAVEYVPSMTAALYSELLRQLGPQVKFHKAFPSFFKGVYARWVLNVYPNVTLTNLITYGNKNDLPYFRKKYKLNILPCSVKEVPVYIKEIRVGKLNNYEKIKQMYTGDNFEEDLRELRGFYIGLSGDSNFFGVPPWVIEKTQMHELFGSIFNIGGEKYCSIHDLERKFGSSGPFEKYEFEDDQIYWCNPPFDTEIMFKAAMYTYTQLLRARSCEVFMVIPNWEARDKYGDFHARILLDANHYQSKVLPRNEYPYYNYTTDSLIDVSTTVIYHLRSPVCDKTPKITITDILELWRRFL